MTDCRHRHFLSSWRSNEAVLSERYDYWRVRCGHCKQLISGCSGPEKATEVEVIWNHDGSSWFGSFTVQA